MSAAQQLEDLIRRIVREEIARRDGVQVDEVSPDDDAELRELAATRSMHARRHRKAVSR